MEDNKVKFLMTNGVTRSIRFPERYIDNINPNKDEWYLWIDHVAINNKPVNWKCAEEFLNVR